MMVFSFTSSCLDTQLLIVVVGFRGCYCLHPLLLHNSSSHWILGNPASSFLKVRKPSNLGVFDKLDILLPSHFSSLGGSNFHCCYSLGASIFLCVPFTVHPSEVDLYFNTLHSKQLSLFLTRTLTDIKTIIEVLIEVLVYSTFIQS